MCGDTPAIVALSGIKVDGVVDEREEQEGLQEEGGLDVVNGMMTMHMNR